MSKGTIVEQGTHDELISMGGEYHDLVRAQQITARDAEIHADSTEDDTDCAIPEEEIEQEPDMHEDPLRLTRTNTKQSVASIALKNKKVQVEGEYSAWTLFKMINRLNSPEKRLLITGGTFAALMGGGQPANGIFFAKSVIAISQPDTKKMKSDISFWALMFLMLGLVQLFANCIASSCMGVASEKLVRRVRDVSFRHILRQEMAYFDDEAHSTGGLTTFLSIEAIDIAGLSGTTAATILSALVTLVAAIAISIAVSWRVGLVCTACVPLLVGAGFFRLFLLRKFERQKQKVYQQSASYASEACGAIRTVSSLTRDRDVWENYHNQLETQTISGLRSNLRTSILYALSESIVILVVALGFWWGAKLISESLLTFEGL